jgi:hypothetical protein
MTSQKAPRCARLIDRRNATMVESTQGTSSIPGVLFSHTTAEKDTDDADKANALKGEKLTTRAARSSPKTETIERQQPEDAKIPVKDEKAVRESAESLRNEPPPGSRLDILA